MKKIKKMKKMRDYVCLEYIKAQLNIIKLEDLIKNPGKRVLFGEVVSDKGFRKDLKRLEAMTYCRNCKYRKDCVMYQTRKDDNKGDKKWN